MSPSKINVPLSVNTCNGPAERYRLQEAKTSQMDPKLRTRVALLTLGLLGAWIHMSHISSNTNAETCGLREVAVVFASFSLQYTDNCRTGNSVQ